MRQIITALLGTAALSLACTSGALAADMPTKAARYAAPSAFNWTGFYAGVNAGYGWASTSVSGFSGSSNLNGFVGGGQIGYNWQGASPLVLGIEADFQGTGQSRSDTALGITVDQKLPWFGTVRGRVGYAFDRAMIYATGGLAYLDYKMTVSGFGVSASSSATKAGWTAGAGVEWMLWDRWSTKLEYLYIDTGDTSVTLFGVPFTGRAKDNIVRVGLNYHF